MLPFDVDSILAVLLKQHDASIARAIIPTMAR
ncbi:hypothetical protein RCH09_002078 [Actimicrobium sp. GrIS 1.19]|nr:hypothetical protein [Actimicrobium sp. GrIS 1.19]